MTKEIIKTNENELFKRVVDILEQARNNVVRSVNSNMVLAYWLIGREIVEEIQGGQERAEYGEKIISNLSIKLSKKYGSGFSVTTLKYFRTFYQVYSNQFAGIGRPSGDQLKYQQKGRLSGDRSATPEIPNSMGKEVVVTEKRYPSDNESVKGFNPNLSWSHYRALMRVKNERARNFYEQEAAECGWSKTQLERQIHTSYYERIITNQGEKGLLPANRERLPGNQIAPVHLLKSPMVLEFLDLPDTPNLHETHLEQAIIDNLQAFLLELGKGFSFVARQKHISIDDDDFYVDLVFYNFILKCFLLIDLKLGKLTHQDIGQMDGYVRLFEDRFKVEGDNPTVGLILCSSKSRTVAKYSILSENRQIFASKYMDFLPTEKELSIEIEKERTLIEAAKEDLDEIK
jgi:predicted nuclease of restriction endonuclease-like (RecB) superfamily